MNAPLPVETIAQAASFVPSNVLTVCGHRRRLTRRHQFHSSKTLRTTKGLIPQAQTIPNRDELPSESAALAGTMPLPDFYLNHPSHRLPQCLPPGAADGHFV